MVINTAKSSVGFYLTVSRHDNARASSSLLIWLNETVRLWAFISVAAHAYRMSPLIWCTTSRFIRHWQDLQLQHGRQAEYTAPQLPIVHKAAENLCASQMDKDIKAVCTEYLFMQQRLCICVPEWLWITPTTNGRDFAYCLKSHGGVRGIYMSLWWHSMHCTPFY